MEKFDIKIFQANSFVEFFLEAMTVRKSPQIFALWKVAISNVCDVIWTSRNKRVFDGISTSLLSAKAIIWAWIREAEKLQLGWIRNNIEDWITINKIGVKGQYPKSSSITEVHWNFPPRGWIKCNIDGLAFGSPGLGGCGGIFRTSRGFTKACFSWGLGVCFAFEAEMMGFIIAVEKANEFNWNNIWLESDSMYIVNLFNHGIGQIPWSLHNRWLRAVYYAKRLNMVVSHIFREGNSVADRLASQASSLQLKNWWMTVPESLAKVAYRDHLDLPYYRFSN